MNNNLAVLKNIVDSMEERIKTIYDRETHNYDSGRDKRIFEATKDSYYKYLYLLQRWIWAEDRGKMVKLNFMSDDIEEVQ